MALSGCTGVIDATSPGPGSEPEPPAEVPSTPGVPDGCAAPNVGASPLTRLTSDQYARTVYDLLQIEPDVVVLRGADEKPGAFVSNSQAPLSEPTVDTYRLPAEGVAVQAVAQVERFFSCDVAKLGEAACAERFIGEVGLKA